MRRGEMWWVDVPGSGRRPYLVLTRDTAIPLLTRLVSVPATRTIRGLPTEVPLGCEDGMPAECVLSLDNVQLLRKARFVTRICRLSATRLSEVCVALNRATGCRPHA